MGKYDYVDSVIIQKQNDFHLVCFGIFAKFQQLCHFLSI
jgi:hypothetical protein